jgi:MoxR-like ATPase
VDDLKSVLSVTNLIKIQEAVRQVVVETTLEDYLIEIVRATRRHPGLRLGASMRSSLGLYRAAQAKAFLEKRTFVLPDDIKQLASPVLSHRIHPRRGQGSEAIRAAEEVVSDILEKTPCPR